MNASEQVVIVNPDRFRAALDLKTRAMERIQEKRRTVSAKRELACVPCVLGAHRKCAGHCGCICHDLAVFADVLYPTT